MSIRSRANCFWLLCFRQSSWRPRFIRRRNRSSHPLNRFAFIRRIRTTSSFAAKRSRSSHPANTTAPSSTPTSITKNISPRSIPTASTTRASSAAPTSKSRRNPSASCATISRHSRIDSSRRGCAAKLPATPAAATSSISQNGIPNISNAIAHFSPTHPSAASSSRSASSPLTTTK